MFTGIIEDVGRIRAIRPEGRDSRLVIDVAGLAPEVVSLGESIAVNGVCLTVAECDEAGFAADASRETLACTTLGGLAAGDPVNLERALALGARLGGHLVSGHVDGVGRVVSRADEGRSVRFVFEAPASLARYVARKGSICIDGVSLTVNAVDDRRFDVQIVPHTLEHTIIAGYVPGAEVNLEVDLVARYVERLLQGEAGVADNHESSSEPRPPRDARIGEERD